MVSDKQRKEAAPPATPPGCSPETTKYFLAEVINALFNTFFFFVFALIRTQNNQEIFIHGLYLCR